MILSGVSAMPGTGMVFRLKMLFGIASMFAQRGSSDRREIALESLAPL